MIRKTLLAAYSLFAYVVFLAGLVWVVLFLVDGPAPTSIDNGQVTPWQAAVAIDLALLGLFAVQHSVMARRSFKRLWRRVVPDAAERSTYVLIASAILLLTYWQWRPITPTVWDLRTTSLAVVLVMAGYAVGWLIVVGSTFMVDHFDFFGLRRVAAVVRDHEYRPGTFRERWLYAWIRHPMMLGLLVVFWCAPRMSLGHLLFAGAASGYIAVGVLLEERDLRCDLGDVYADYARRVPAIIPGIRRGAQGVDESSRAASLAPR